MKPGLILHPPGVKLLRFHCKGKATRRLLTNSSETEKSQIKVGIGQLRIFCYDKMQNPVQSNLLVL